MRHVGQHIDFFEWLLPASTSRESGPMDTLPLPLQYWIERSIVSIDKIKMGESQSQNSFKFLFAFEINLQIVHLNYVLGLPYGY
jgi:hypothetical protein